MSQPKAEPEEDGVPVSERGKDQKITFERRTPLLVLAIVGGTYLLAMIVYSLFSMLGQ